MTILIKRLLRETLDKTITCKKCSWHWKESESDKKDLFICHKCGFDNKLNETLINEKISTSNDIGIRKISDFVNFAKEYLGISDNIKIILTRKRTEDLTTVAYYKPNELIKVYIKDRLLCDIFRSLSHELQHHKQYLDGRLTDLAKAGADGSDIENEANSTAGIIIRRYGKLHPEIYYEQL